MNCVSRFNRKVTGTTLVVDREHCVGCNLCQMVCPVEDCITMIRTDDGVKATTWRDRSLAPAN